MEMKFIREFIVLAETENFLEASERLFISHSSLSRHLQAMEEELGAQLFDRTTRKVKLNSFGRLFLQYAREIDRIQYEYTTAFYNKLRGVRGTVRVGAPPTMIPYRITEVLARFQQENSAFSLEIIEEDSLHLVKMLRAGHCDLAFIREPSDENNEFNKLPYASDVLIALLPEKHLFAKRDAIQLSDLAHEPLLLAGKDTFSYSFCIGECRKAGFEPRVAFTGHSLENTIDLIVKGMGVALQLKHNAASSKKQGIAIVNIEPTIRSFISLAYPKNVILSEAANHFLNLAKTVSQY